MRMNNAPVGDACLYSYEQIAVIQYTASRKQVKRCAIAVAHVDTGRTLFTCKNLLAFSFQATSVNDNGKRERNAAWLQFRTCAGMQR